MGVFFIGASFGLILGLIQILSVEVLASGVCANVSEGLLSMWSESMKAGSGVLGILVRLQTLLQIQLMNCSRNQLGVPTNIVG